MLHWRSPAKSFHLLHVRPHRVDVDYTWLTLASAVGVLHGAEHHFWGIFQCEVAYGKLWANKSNKKTVKVCMCDEFCAVFVARHWSECSEDENDFADIVYWRNTPEETNQRLKVVQLSEWKMRFGLGVLQISRMKFAFMTWSEVLQSALLTTIYCGFNLLYKTMYDEN